MTLRGGLGFITLFCEILSKVSEDLMGRVGGLGGWELLEVD